MWVYENDGAEGRRGKKGRKRGAHFGKGIQCFLYCLGLRRGAAMGAGLDSQARKGRQTYPDS